MTCKVQFGNEWYEIDGGLNETAQSIADAMDGTARTTVLLSTNRRNRLVFGKHYAVVIAGEPTPGPND